MSKAKGPTTIYDPNNFSPDAAYVLNQHKSATKRLINKICNLLPGMVVSGPTTNRPVLSANNPGAMYFDTTLGKPVWWNGTAWVDATGTSA